MSETIQDTLTRLQAFCLQLNPSADIAPGTVLNELVLKLSSALNNPIYNDIQTLNQANSVQAALASTTDTTNPIIDGVASNFLTNRNQGAYSTGQIKVTVSVGNRGYTITAGTAFLQPTLGLQYVTTQAYSFGPNTNQTPLIANPDGTFYFLLGVQAAAVGSQYQVPNGTAFSVVAPAVISNIVTATAYGNFTSGLPADTDKQLIAKMKSNLTNQCLTVPRSIQAALAANFPNFQTLSALGANDPEMVRSKRNVLGTSTFGKADIYVRTTLASESIVVTKLATKTGVGTWQVTIAAIDAPGFYRVLSLLPTPVGNVLYGGTLVIDNINYGYDPNQFLSNNSIVENLDARFTAYQTATINFEYVETPTQAVGTTASFDISVSYQPNIRDIQSLFQSVGTRVLCGDYLVKAALPCFVSLDLSIIRRNLTDTADSIGIASMKQDIFNYINTIPFGESLYASKIIDICHNYPIKRVDLPIQMTGEVYTVNGTSISISSSDVLTIPTSLSDGVTPNTTLYFMDYFNTGSSTSVDNIGINLV